MAYLPCHQGMHRHPARNVNVYLALFNGQSGDRTSFRLCLGHWDGVEHDLAQFELDSIDFTGGPGGYSTKCVSCLKPVDEGGRQFFLTAYPAKNERKDYWGKLHDACRLPWTFEPPLAWTAAR